MGAEFIAIILSGYFNETRTEKEILNIMNKGDFRASFDDMQKALDTIGFASKDYAVSFQTLQSLKVPVIVYVRHRKIDNFSVVSGINDQYVQL